MPCQHQGGTPQTDRNTVVGNLLTHYDEYFPGVVAKNKPNGKVYIRYDDSDEQWIHLEEVSYFLLTETDADRRPDNPPLSRLEIGTRLSVWWQSIGKVVL